MEMFGRKQKEKPATVETIETLTAQLKEVRDALKPLKSKELELDNAYAEGHGALADGSIADEKRRLSKTMKPFEDKEARLLEQLRAMSQ